MNKLLRLLFALLCAVSFASPVFATVDQANFLEVNDASSMHPNARIHADGMNTFHTDNGGQQTYLFDVFRSATDTGNTTLLSTSVTVRYGDASGAAFAYTMPSCSATGYKLFYIKKTDSSGNAITINRAGSDTFEGGGTSLTLSTQNDGYWLQSDGTSKWYILNLYSTTIPATRIGSGSVDNTEFGYLDGVTSSVQTQLGNKQGLDSTLTSLAAFNTNGLLTQTAADTFTARTITGTSNRLDVSNGNGVSGNPTLDISSSYVGQSSITTLGTIGTGVWNGTKIGVAYGGTNTTATPTNGQIHIGNGTDFTLATLTQGTGITITNGAGTITIAATGGGSGTVTDFSAGDLAPLFTTSEATTTTTPALTFNLTDAAAYTVFGRNAGTTGSPSYFTLTKNHQLATTVYTDQANTYSSGTQDFSSISSKFGSIDSFSSSTKTATTGSLSATDPNFIFFDSSAGNQTYTLPTTGSGKVFFLKHTAGNNSVTINRGGTDTLNGSGTSISLNAGLATDHGYAIIQKVGTNWEVLAIGQSQNNGSVVNNGAAYRIGANTFSSGTNSFTSGVVCSSTVDLSSATVTPSSQMVMKNQSNAYSTGTQDFTSATSVRLQRYTLEGRAQNIGSGTKNLTTSDPSIQEFSGSYTVNLPAISGMAPGTGTANYFLLKNIGSTTITVAPNGSESIDGSNSSYTIPAGGSSFIWADGSSWVTLNNSIGILRPSNGMIPIGTGSGWTNATLTQGTGISITNGSGSITIDSTVQTPTFKQKAADTSRASNTTVSDDPDLVCAVAANGSYKFELTLGVMTPGTSNPDLKLTIAGPSGSTISFAGWGDNNGGTIAPTSGGTTVAIPVGNSSTIPETIHISGSISGTYSAGNLSLRWAQNTSNGTGTAMKAGSSMVVYPQ